MLALQLSFKESTLWGCVTGLRVAFRSGYLPFCPLQALTLYTLSAALYKMDLKRTSRGHLLAFSVTNQLYLVSAWGKVYKERQYLLCDQLIQLKKQTHFGVLEPFVGTEEEKASFRAKYPVKIISKGLSL